MKHLLTTPRIFPVLLLLAATVGARATSLVEGRVYLKDGSVVECTGSDRLQIPRKSRPLKIFRDAFLKTRTKETLRAESIDSAVCWHPKTPAHPRRFVPTASPGWMWVYFETPHIRACVYSTKGYGIDTNGGIQVWQRRGWFSRSRTAYFLQRPGGEGLYEVGDASRRTKNRFRERLARYVADDDPGLADRIRRSDTDRSKTLLMLRGYEPTKE